MNMNKESYTFQFQIEMEQKYKEKDQEIQNLKTKLKVAEHLIYRLEYALLDSRYTFEQHQENLRCIRSVYVKA